MRFEDYIIEVNRTRRLFNEVLHKKNLTGNKWVIMDYISNNDDVTSKDIQNEFFMSKTTVSQIVNEMIRQKLITTEVSPTDKRSKFLKIDDEGIKLQNYLKEFKKEMINKLGEEHIKQQTIGMMKTRNAIGEIYKKLDK